MGDEADEANKAVQLQPKSNHLTFRVTPEEQTRSSSFAFITRWHRDEPEKQTAKVKDYIVRSNELVDFDEDSGWEPVDDKCASVKLEDEKIEITPTGSCDTISIRYRFGNAIATEPMSNRPALTPVQGWQGASFMFDYDHTKNYFIEILDGTEPVSVYTFFNDTTHEQILKHLQSARFRFSKTGRVFVTSASADDDALKRRIRFVVPVATEVGTSSPGLVTAGDLYDLAFPDTIVPDVLQRLRDNSRKRADFREPWRSRLFHMWRPGGRVFFESTERVALRVFNLVRLAYLGGNVADQLREILIYLRTVTQDGVSANDLHNLLELRGTDALCNSALFRAPLQSRDAVVAEIERQSALPVSQRNGLSLTVYAWESMNRYIDEDKSNPCATAARIAGAIGTDGCNLERGTYVACVACVLDSSLRGTARALTQCTPIEFGPTPSAPVYIHTRRVVSAFLADACDVRIKAATDRAQGMIDDHPWRALALLRSVGMCVHDLALACGRAVRCEGTRQPAQADQVRAADAMLGTQFERAAQLAESYGFLPTLVREVAHRVLTAKLRITRARFALPPQSPPELAHVEFLAAAFEQLDVQSDGRPLAATGSSIEDAFLGNLLLKGSAAAWQPGGDWPGPFLRVLPDDDDKKQQQMAQMVTTASSAPSGQLDRVAQTPAYAAEQLAQALTVARGCIDSATGYVQNGAQGSASAVDFSRMLRDAADALFEAAHRATIASFVAGTATNEERVYLQEFEFVYPDAMTSTLRTGGRMVQVTLTNDDSDMLAQQLVNNSTAAVLGSMLSRVPPGPGAAAPSAPASAPSAPAPGASALGAGASGPARLARP